MHFNLQNLLHSSFCICVWPLGPHWEELHVVASCCFSSMMSLSHSRYSLAQRRRQLAAVAPILPSRRSVDGHFFYRTSIWRGGAYVAFVSRISMRTARSWFTMSVCLSVRRMLVSCQNLFRSSRDVILIFWPQRRYTMPTDNPSSGPLNT